MKAVVCPKYGTADVLEIRDVPRPEPGDDEVLIRVHASSLNKGDWHVMTGTPWLVRLMFGLSKPKKIPILGGDVAGVVEAIGKNVKKFQIGDQVFGDLTAYKFGAWAEYVCSDEKSITHIPDGVTMEAAACVAVSGLTALQALSTHGQVQPNQRVLINGATGSVGQLAVQIAKAKGAHVTAVGRTKKIVMLKALVPDAILDATQIDITRPEQPYDLILDAAAYQSMRKFKSALSPGGRYIMIGGTFSRLMQAMILGPIHSKLSGKTFTTMLAQSTPDDLAMLADMLSTDQLKPIIDTTYAIDEITTAMQRLDNREAMGKLVLNLQT